MTEQISWDHSIIKKYSASNHFKLLNQLRSEVKKYPLNKRKYKSSSNSINENKNENKSVHTTFYDQNLNISKKTNEINENNTIKSSISFNNSKNFSIYNNKESHSAKEKEDSILLGVENSNKDFSSSTFKDRLNKIDMK